MKNYLAGIFAAALVLAAFGILSISLAESPGAPVSKLRAVSQSPAVSKSVSAGAASPGAAVPGAAEPSAKAIIPPLTRMPPGPPGPPGSYAKKKYSGGFSDLPMTPPNSDMEDCFNDEIPYTPIPQG